MRNTQNTQSPQNVFIAIIKYVLRWRYNVETSFQFVV